MNTFTLHGMRGGKSDFKRVFGGLKAKISIILSDLYILYKAKYAEDSL